MPKHSDCSQISEGNDKFYQKKFNNQILWGTCKSASLVNEDKLTKIQIHHFFGKVNT